MTSGAFIGLYFLAATPVYSAPISRADVLANADAYLSNSSITVQLGNLVSPTASQGKTCDWRFPFRDNYLFRLCANDILPTAGYKLGGFDTAAGFRSAAAAGGKLIYPAPPVFDRNRTTIPSSSFAGIDCSAFISRVWGISHIATPDLSASANAPVVLSLNPALMQTGDLFVYPQAGGKGHAALLAAKVGSSVSIIHATSDSFPVRHYVYRVIEDFTTEKSCSSNSCLLDGFDLPFETVTPFPVFSALSPANGTVVASAQPTLQATVLSATTINTSRVGFSVDGVPVTGASISGSGHSVQISATPPVLADGQHTLSITAETRYTPYGLDLIDSSTITFTVATQPPSAPGSNTSTGQSPGGGPTTFKSTECVVLTAGDASAGVDTVEVLDGSGTPIQTQSFGCDKNPLEFGPFCDPNATAYSLRVTNCVALQSSTTVTVTSAPYAMSCDQSGCTPYSLSAGALRDAYMEIVMQGPAGSGPPNPTLACSMYSGPGDCVFSCSGGACSVKRTQHFGAAKSASYTVSNSTNVNAIGDVSVIATVYSAGGTPVADVGATLAYTGTPPGGSMTISFDLPEGGQITSKPANQTTVGGYFSYFNILVRAACSFLPEIFRKLLIPANTCHSVGASDFVYTSTAPMNVTFTTTDVHVDVDTATLQAYRFDGVQWSSAGITMTAIFKDTTTGVISASATFTASGEYGFFFVGRDTTPPVSSFGVQGSSFVFDNALFITTDSFIVLSATDALVSGYAVPVASITYRIDPVSEDAQFYVYSDSLTLPLGSHIIQYRAVDYFGNVESIHAATVTVTTGSAFRTNSSAGIGGAVLAGIVGSTAVFETVAGVDSDYVLVVTSANRVPLVTADAVGSLGIGIFPPVAQFDLGISTIALQLRSGNSTSSSSVQLSFGYNGDYAYRSALRTEHSTATEMNRMDFLVWNAVTASTTTLASLNVLSLQGVAAASNGSFHVLPTGQPDVELEVSNGSSLGGGTIQYGMLLSPSSRRFKTDILDLPEGDEGRAMQEIAGLKHVRFRYKSLRDGKLIENPVQPLRTGLIYEEAPASVQDGHGGLSTQERIANAELALKAAMRRLEKLERRYIELKGKGAKP